MARTIKHFFFLLFTFLILGKPAYADFRSGEIEGEYVPTYGWVKSMEVSRPKLGEAPRQIGRFFIVLARSGWADLPEEDKARIRKHLVIRGSFTGQMDLESQTVSHTMVNSHRTGVIYTSGDFLIPTQGDNVCAQGVPLSGTEYIFPVSGEGLYNNLVGGSFQVTGNVNNCPGADNYLQNNFTVVSGQGGLTFSAQ